MTEQMIGALPVYCADCGRATYPGDAPCAPGCDGDES